MVDEEEAAVGETAAEEEEIMSNDGLFLLVTGVALVKLYCWFQVYQVCRVLRRPRKL